MRRFRAADSALTCTYDAELVGCIEDMASAQGFPAGTLGEQDSSLDHATYIPLFFIDKFYHDYKVVRIGLSGLGPLEHYRLGELVSEAVGRLDRKAVFIASGDLSHKLTQDGTYGFAPEGPKFDEQVTQAMASGDFARMLEFDEGFADAAAECGLRSFQIMAGALDGKAIDARLLSYEGPFGVGYAVASFYVRDNDDTRHFARMLEDKTRTQVAQRLASEDAYVSLARQSVNHYVREGTPLPMPAGLPTELTGERSGVFVSLHEHGRLRGCIGTISAVTSSIADEIIRNAISACSADPRFEPVREDELDQLEISVDVLLPAQPISSPDELDPQRYGVIVTNGTRRGLLLPMLDGVDTVEEQIAIARQKAGIAQGEDVELQRFEVIRHMPSDA